MYSVVLSLGNTQSLCLSPVLSLSLCWSYRVSSDCWESDHDANYPLASLLGTWHPTRTMQHSSYTHAQTYRHSTNTCTMCANVNIITQQHRNILEAFQSTYTWDTHLSKALNCLRTRSASYIHVDNWSKKWSRKQFKREHTVCLNKLPQL